MKYRFWFGDGININMKAGNNWNCASSSDIFIVVNTDPVIVNRTDLTVRSVNDAVGTIR